MFSGTPCTKCEGLGWVMFLKHPVLYEGLGWTRMVLYFLFVEAPPLPPPQGQINPNNGRKEVCVKPQC